MFRSFVLDLVEVASACVVPLGVYRRGCGADASKLRRVEDIA